MFLRGGEDVLAGWGGFEDGDGTGVKIEDDAHGKMVGHGEHPEHAVGRAELEAAVGGGDAGEQ